ANTLFPRNARRREGNRPPSMPPDRAGSSLSKRYAPQPCPKWSSSGSSQFVLGSPTAVSTAHFVPYFSHFVINVGPAVQIASLHRLRRPLHFLPVPPRSCRLWTRRHKNQQNQIFGGGISHAVNFTRPGNDDFTGAKLFLFTRDMKCPFPAKNEVDLVGLRVAVNPLILSGFQTVQIAEIFRRIEYRNFLHLVIREADELVNVSRLHFDALL